MITRENKQRLMALCPGHDAEAPAMTEAFQALWAVRVLDNWARKHGYATPAPALWDAGSATREPVYRIWIRDYELSPDLGFDWRHFNGRSPDAARIAAADELVIEDSTIDLTPGLFRP